MEIDPKSAPRLNQYIYHTYASTSINNNNDKNSFILPSFRTNIARASLAYQGIKLWNGNTLLVLPKKLVSRCGFGRYPSNQYFRHTLVFIFG